MPHVWLIAGYTGTGKTTAAHLLAKNLPNARLTAFANQVKDEVATLYGLDRSLLDTQEGKARIYAGITTYRDLLIAHSADMKRISSNPAIWAEHVKQEILQSPEIENWVVHDWRYKAEYECLASFQDIHLHIFRIRTKAPPPIEAQVSEHELDTFPIETIVWNTGSIQELEQNLIQDILSLEK